jgi:hypothetical protein
MGATIKYLRKTTNGAAGNSMGTTITYLRGAAGISLCTAIYLRRTTRQQPGTKAKYLRCTTSNAAGIDLSRYRGLLICPFTTSAPRSPGFVGTSFANKQNITAKALGLRAQCIPTGH